MQSNHHLVFVRCFTYNHESYIEDALYGFAMQQTNFPYVVAVVDDASTDNNALVITEWISKNCDSKENYCIEDKEYGKVIQAQARNNPNCIFYVILLNENHYRKKPRRPYFAQLEKSAKYIAWCEGDDYWINRHKLQKQVDFLESHPDYQLVFHNAIVHYEDKQIPDCVMKTFLSSTYGTSQLFELWQLPMASVVYRSEIENSEIMLKLAAIWSGGLARFVASSLCGKVYGISECMSVYRKNKGGLSCSMKPSQFICNGNEMAIATGDKDAIEVRRKRTIQILVDYMPAILRGDDRTQDMWATAKKYYPWAPYKALMKYLFTQMPMRIVRKAKHIIVRK